MDAYKENYGPESDRVGQYAEQQKTLLSAIQIAAQCKDENGTRDSHQNRIPQLILDEWSNAVAGKVRALRAASSFDALYIILKQTNVKGIGELTIYDSATRIGRYLKKYPERIYLHAGTRTGLRKLMGKVKGSYLFKNELPPELRQSRLSCSAIENLLCIYKDALDPLLDGQSFQRALSKVASKCQQPPQQRPTC